MHWIFSFKIVTCLFGTVELGIYYYHDSKVIIFIMIINFFISIIDLSKLLHSHNIEMPCKIHQPSQITPEVSGILIFTSILKY